MKLDDIKKLHQKKYRNEFAHFLVEGEHLVLELEKAALSNEKYAHCELFVTEKYKNFPTKFNKTLLSDKQFAQLSETKTPQGIIALVPQVQNIFGIPKKERAIYLYEVQDPGNLGTILRTLAWFGNFRCILSPDSVDPYNSKVVRASMGAIFHVPLELDVSVLSLKNRFNTIACLDIQGASLSVHAFKENECYLFGNEARGVPAEAVSQLNAGIFSIQGCGAIESLNVAAAVNMCVYELMR